MPKKFAPHFPDKIYTLHMEDTIDIGEYYALKLEEKHIGDLLFLFQEAFGFTPNYTDIRNKHLFCHGDVKFVGFIAYHKQTNEPAAYYGVFPTYIEYQGEKYLAAQSGDTMTHPKHQKKGLFVNLAKITFDFCEKAGIRLIFGFPNNNSYPGFIKHLSFVSLPPLMDFTFAENKFEAYRISRHASWLWNMHKKYAGFILGMFSQKAEPFANSNGISSAAFVYRDEDYYKTKGLNDTFFVRIKGFSLWIKISQNVFIIGDIHADASANWQDLRNQLQRIAFFSGMRFFSFSLSKNSALLESVSSVAHSAHAPQKVIIRDFNSGIPPTNFAFQTSDIDVF